jgi:ribosomal protein L37AE/L43A
MKCPKCGKYSEKISLTASRAVWYCSECDQSFFKRRYGAHIRRNVDYFRFGEEFAFFAVKGRVLQ